MGTRVCRRCDIEKPFEQFIKPGKPLSTRRICAACRSKQTSEWRWKNHAKFLDTTRKRRERNRKKIYANIHDRGKRLKRDVLRKYGGVCACCREPNWECLTIDHINGDGVSDRWRVAGNRNRSRALYLFLFRTERIFPDYRVLCFNCNWSIGKYGYCPHQKPKLRKMPIA